MNIESGLGPLISDDVVLHPPQEDGNPWILQAGTRRYIRIHAEMARLVEHLDGAHSIDGLVGTLGGEWTSKKVEEAVERLRGMGLLESGEARLGEKRFQFEGLHRIQFTLLRTPALFNMLRPLARLVVSKPSQIVCFGLIMSGILALLVDSTEVLRTVTTPVALTTYLAVSVASLAMMFLHEFAHGLVLTGFGGTPSRIGVMLFYFTPAFFCDVTDGWRLPRKNQRVVVALAGILFQLVVAGLVSIIALFPISTELSTALIIFAVLNYVSCFINVLPFIKLDGYLALMTYLDKPFLREKMMAGARNWILRVLFGGTDYGQSPSAGTVFLGILSMVMPLYIVGTLLMTISESVKGLGSVSTWIGMAAIVGFVLYLMNGFLKLLHTGREHGASRTRSAIATLAVLVAIGVAGFVVTVPADLRGGYIKTSDGLYFVSLSPVGNLQPGVTAELYSRGIVASTAQGEASIVDCGIEMTAPIAAILPVAMSGTQISVYACSLKADTQVSGESGGASIRKDRLPLWQWIYSELPFVHASDTSE